MGQLIQWKRATPWGLLYTVILKSASVYWLVCKCRVLRVYAGNVFRDYTAKFTQHNPSRSLGKSIVSSGFSTKEEARWLTGFLGYWPTLGCSPCSFIWVTWYRGILWVGPESKLSLDKKLWLMSVYVNDSFPYWSLWLREAASIWRLFFFKLINFLLKDNCFTEFCCFLSNLNVNQPWVYIYPLPFEIPSHLPSYPTPLGWYRAIKAIW